MFEGIEYSKRNDLKGPDIVLPKGTLRKLIFPNNRVYHLERGGLIAGPEAWFNEPMHGNDKPAGEYGVSVCVKLEGKELRGNLIVTITSSK